MGYPIHIICKFAHAAGGGEQRALSLGRILARHASVHFWTTHAPDPALLKQAPIAQIDSWRLRFPKTGTFIFIGSYLHIGRWFRWSMPRRKIVVFNTKQPDELARLCRTLSPKGIDGCEIVYADDDLRACVGAPGVIQRSPIDIGKFLPRPHPRTSAFTVGRMSRDYRYKFHENSPRLYRKLSDEGIAVRIMGGMCLVDDLSGAEHVTLIPTGAEPAVDFLHSIDCFLYRTRSDWYESYGRVVFEAMACGLPVVCGVRGGYARYIEHGVNGFLFGDGDEALAIIKNLRDDPGLRHRIGDRARATAEKLYGPDFEKDIAQYYTR
jgi:glycosyltransferase involved in cell wall biosynthesis